MYITLDTVKKYDLDEEYIGWFSEVFPNGAELIDIINSPKITMGILHWIYSKFSTTAEEKAAYYEETKVDCNEYNYTIYESDNITFCSYVVNSSNISDSNHVFDSEDVSGCDNVSGSNNVEDSGQVFNSEFVYTSRCVLNSKNVTNGANIINSNYVVKSHSIYNAAAVKNSAFVTDVLQGNTKQINGSQFISSCQDLENCLFCYGINNKKYHIFNKEVSPDEFDLIVKQMKSILKNWTLTLVVRWPDTTIPLDEPKIERNITKQFAGLPDKFWRWVATLPGYDPMILYQITYQPNLIGE